MDNPYNELKRAQKLINVTLHNEEDKFLSTLSRGLKILEEESRLLAPVIFLTVKLLLNYMILMDFRLI